MSSPKIIVSLDVDNEAALLALVEQFNPDQCRLKIGKEMFTRYGPLLVEKLINKDFDVFLDLKFHDIPNTVARACIAAADLGVWMLNVHASGGYEMLCKAREAIDSCNHQPLLIAVTVLTSLSTRDLQVIGVGVGLEEQVLKLASLSQAAGLDGVVCSANEIIVIRQKSGRDFKLVTPGIRPAGAEVNDQKRVMTPLKAIQAGSDYLVIGRPITQAKDPLQALIDIEDEINAAI